MIFRIEHWLKSKEDEEDKEHWLQLLPFDILDSAASSKHF